MKTAYLKPVVNDELMSADELMITASAGGETIIENGGNTSDGSITTGDSRVTDIWDDEE